MEKNLAPIFSRHRAIIIFFPTLLVIALSASLFLFPDIYCRQDVSCNKNHWLDMFGFLPIAILLGGTVLLSQYEDLYAWLATTALAILVIMTIVVSMQTARPQILTVTGGMVLVILVMLSQIIGPRVWRIFASVLIIGGPVAAIGLLAFIVKHFVTS